MKERWKEGVSENDDNGKMKEGVSENECTSMSEIQYAQIPLEVGLYGLYSGVLLSLNCCVCRTLSTPTLYINTHTLYQQITIDR